jgi:lipopolysaccharide transport system permease protein
VLLPVSVVFAALASIGPALPLAVLNVKYRDSRHAVPFIIQLGIYASPVAYATSIVPAESRTLFHLNPVVGIIVGFRWCLLGGQTQIHPEGMTLSFLVSCILLWVGVRVFRNTERIFADVI